jgi:hypothetical protein
LRSQLSKWSQQLPGSPRSRDATPDRRCSIDEKSPRSARRRNAEEKLEPSIEGQERLSSTRQPLRSKLSKRKGRSLALESIAHGATASSRPSAMEGRPAYSGSHCPSPSTPEPVRLLRCVSKESRSPVNSPFRAPSNSLSLFVNAKEPLFGLPIDLRCRARCRIFRGSGTDSFPRPALGVFRRLSLRIPC